jgi:hypothetical protein
MVAGLPAQARLRLRRLLARTPRACCRVETARLVFTDPVDGLWLSDHLGVLAEAEIGPQE